MRFVILIIVIIGIVANWSMQVTRYLPCAFTLPVHSVSESDTLSFPAKQNRLVVFVTRLSNGTVLSGAEVRVFSQGTGGGPAREVGKVVTDQDG